MDDHKKSHKFREHLRVLHLSSEATWRGGEQQIAYLIQESRKQGLQCHAICKKGSAFSKWCGDEKIPFHEAAFKNSFDIVSALSLKKYVAEHSIELIHIHSGKGHGIYALSTLIGTDAPSVLSRRVDFPIKSNPWARWKYNLKSIKKIICVSDAIREMTKVGIKESHKLVTIHSGIDLSRFEHVEKVDLQSTYGIEEDMPLIGNVSALAPHKDYSTFLKTARKFMDLGLKAHFLIIGEGPERVKIEAEIKELSLKDHVTMTGFIADVPSVLKALDLFLITSETEGLGTSVLDAFASGIPVVATAAGGIPESVIHGRTGLLCPVKDTMALSNALRKILEDDTLKKSLVTGARSHLKNFTKERTAQKTFAIYREVLSK